MSLLHIHTIRDPLNAPEAARVAVTTLARAEAMGLLAEGEVIEVLDVPTLRKVVTGIARAGIGQGVLATLATHQGQSPKHLSAALTMLNEALDASPLPSHEWAGLTNLLGVERLARLVGVSPGSVRRYGTRVRETPDDIAARLHFLALVVADLAGAYNDIGIRRWFERLRTLLGNKTPARLLTGKWRPEDPGPLQVRQLAHALVASPVT